MDRETAEEIKQHFNVVAESLRAEIRTVAEALVAMNATLDRIEPQVSEQFNETKATIRLSTELFRHRSRL